MKKLLSFLIILSVCSVFAQSPQKMSYQAILRNTSDGLIINTAVGMKVSILKGSVTGTVVYEETHTTTTNINGLISIEIGAGNITSGSFAAINWGNDSYFVKTETDPTGGNNYTITGTSQLLSVPYAFYAETTKPVGKSNIYLKGDITDAEAAAQLGRELGSSTEFVNIISTTVLTTVNLDAATTLVRLTVTNNTALTTLSVNGITQCYEYINVRDNPSLTTLTFNSLTKSDRIDIWNNALQTVSFLSLRKITTGNNLGITSPNITSINLPQLTEGDIEISNTSVTTLNIPNYTNGRLTLFGGSTLSSVSLPNYTSGRVYIGGSVNLTSFSAPNYTTSTGMTISNAGLTSLSLPNLNISNSEILIDANPSLSSISFPNLQYTTGTYSSLKITNNTSLTTISLPSFLSGNLYFSGTSLSTVNLPNLHTGGIINITNSSIQTLNFPALTTAAFDFRNNPQLTSVTMPNLTSVLGMTQQFSSNHLSSASVNSILHQFTLVPGLSGMRIYLYQQNPLAPPTGQGITDKATLVGAGNYIYTD
ncbi:leucine-rich repeat domain-containing protein [Flavobacterium sangjuense]|uniref:Receptor L-domain domain-containing protein n=1 Tax=Flavobacterium sangjuense TaxID=2518177 RepID=A0A4P7PVL4_9FLAO|nr:hypothetical protein [Flavobacterium sangjuense]QBZ99051.1 hypothetical protein GS03_02567 [Flavobacterium sangjuense]